MRLRTWPRPPWSRPRPRLRPPLTCHSHGLVCRGCGSALEALGRGLIYREPALGHGLVRHGRSLGRGLSRRGHALDHDLVRLERPSAAASSAPAGDSKGQRRDATNATASSERGRGSSTGVALAASRQAKAVTVPTATRSTHLAKGFDLGMQQEARGRGPWTWKQEAGARGQLTCVAFCLQNQT